MNTKSVYLFVLSFVGLLPAQSLKMTVSDPVKAKRCLEEGRRLEARAAPDGPGNQRLFEKALAKYLCAAHAGSAEGALSAVVLSTSGMAPKLSLDSIRMLSKMAADGGIFAGYSALAESYCGDGGFLACDLDAHKAVSILFEGNKACSCKEFSFDIGDVLLGIAKTTADTSHAFACYKQANGKGVRKKLDKIIKSSPLVDTSLKCEYSR